MTPLVTDHHPSRTIDFAARGSAQFWYPHSLVLLQEFLPCPKQRNPRFRLD